MNKIIKDNVGSGDNHSNDTSKYLSSMSYENRGVSVIICCYNSEKIIAETLTHIFNQEVNNSTPWEVILVNNGSTDNTVEIAQDTWNNHPCEVPFQIIKQSVPGKANALKKGFKHARYEFILICDDDNFLAADYLQTAFDIMVNNPQVGCLGGCGYGQTEGDFPDWFSKFKNHYACGEQSKTGYDVTFDRKYVYGAGSVIRKSVFKELNDDNYLKVFPGRKNKNLVGGEDNLICYIAVISGFKIWYTDRLKFTHKINQDRLNWDYLKNISFTNGKTCIYLEPFTDYINGKQKPQGFIKKLVTNIKHLLSLTKKNGLKIFKNSECDDKKLRVYFYIGKIKELLKLNFSYKKQYQKSIQYCDFVKNKNLSAQTKESVTQEPAERLI